MYEYEKFSIPDILCSQLYFIPITYKSMYLHKILNTFLYNNNKKIEMS